MDQDKAKQKIKTLMDSNYKYREIFNTAPDGIVLMNKLGVITECNRSASEIIGIPGKELLGKHFTQLKIVKLKDFPKHAKTFQNIIKGKLNKPYRESFTDKNQKTHFLELSPGIIKRDGKIVGIQVFLRDITSKVETENKLIESEKRYRLLSKELDKSKTWFERLFRESPDGIIIMDKLGVITDCNKVALNIVGVEREDLIGRHFSKVGPLYPVDIPRYFKIYYELIKGKEILPFEVKLKTGTEKPIYAECHVGALKEEGKVVELLLVLRDISRRKEAEKALVESEKQYRSLFENSMDGIYRTTIDGKYIDVNPALIKMLGYGSKEEVLALNVSKQVYAEKESRPKPKEREKAFEAKLKNKNGNIITTEINSRVVYEDGKPAYYEGIVRDITERKKAEEKIKHLSFHDYLTGLYNRAFFEEELNRLDTGRQLPLTIIIGDVNGLKIINDAYGHERGDKLLQNISDVLKTSFRSEDVVSRWGGDEFIVILPNTSGEEAQKILKRTMVLLKKNSKETLPLSVSFGISVKEKPSQNIDKVLKEAEDRMYRNKLLMKQGVHSSIVSSLGKALEKKDYETAEHLKRMKILAEKLGKKLKLTNEVLEELSLLASLHDIGKISIADSIILKPRSLSRKEWEKVKKHPIVGYRIAESSGELAPIARGILQHHEWWNGKGYPEGIKGEKIPLISRIVSIVDAFDSMTHDKPYRKAYSKKEAAKELEKFAGTQFDPKLVKEFISIIKKD